MNAETPETNGPRWFENTRLVAGTVAVAFVLVASFVINAWSQGQPATRSEIAQTVANLDPACRPIVGIRMREHLIREGRPLSRREMGKVADGITSCKDINDQLDGLADAARE